MGEREKPKTNYVALVALVLVTGFLVLQIPWLAGSYRVARMGAHQTAQRTECMNRLKRIETAMREYHDEYGRFPPAYTVDEAGKPLHSWRTLLLPFLGQKELYAKIELDEPWDSPDNLAVYENFPLEIYQCPIFFDEGAHVARANYVLVTGPECVSDGPTSRSLEELPEGAGKMLHVVEARFPVRWYEPGDLEDEEATFRVNDEAAPCIGSHHPGIVLGAFCDGSVYPLSAGTDPEKLRAMFEGKAELED